MIICTPSRVKTSVPNFVPRKHSPFIHKCSIYKDYLLLRFMIAWCLSICGSNVCLKPTTSSFNYLLHIQDLLRKTASLRNWEQKDFNIFTNGTYLKKIFRHRPQLTKQTFVNDMKVTKTMAFVDNKQITFVNQLYSISKVEQGAIIEKFVINY